MSSPRRTGPILFLLLAAAAFGCAEERDPIVRVQPGALEKSFFVAELGNPIDDPEFYWRNFVVDGSEAQSMIGIGSWSAVDRIRWDIQEELLVARKAYPLAVGADDKGDPGDPDGTIVAAYPVLDHFDIRRAYNPQTGEDLNIVEENSDDRPWYERAYMRVDWSINLVDTPAWMDMFLGKLIGEIKVTPIAYYVSDPNHPDAPHFEPEQGYFDITSKFFVEPEQIDSPFSDIDGKVPRCILTGFYTGNALDNCDPQSAIIRSSYLKVDAVDADGDFEPLTNNRASLDIVGNPGGLGDSLGVGVVTPPRIRWDPQYGYTDAGLLRLMHVHNIWEKSHQTSGSCSTSDDCGGFGAGSRCLPSGACTLPCDYGARVDGNDNGTDDQCENGDTGYEGSEGADCSVRNRCTIPYRDREIRPIGFWMNPEMPEDLTDPVDPSGRPLGRGASEDILYTWNQALRTAVARAREVECRRTSTGDARVDCHGEFFDPGGIEMVSFGGWGIPAVADMPDVLVACHNPVRAYDASLCGPEGYSARVGDLRHNFLFYWPYASRAPWGGIGNWSADPLTGQILGASATTMGRSASAGAAQTRDIIMVANGELTIADITGGTPASLYQKALQEGRAPKALSSEEIQRRVRSVDVERAFAQLAPSTSAVDRIDELQQRLTQGLEVPPDVAVNAPGQQAFEVMAGRLLDSGVAADLITPNWTSDLLSVSSGPLDASTAHALSPLGGADPAKLNDYLARIEQRAQLRGACFAEYQQAGNVGSPDVQGLARYFLNKYNDDRLEEELAQDAPRDPASLRAERAARIYDDLWKQTYQGIQFHEVGHALGFLHQFASSYDSPNYNPQYWQLRTNEGQAAASCNGEPRPEGADSCMGPRYLDPETSDELGFGEESRPGINYFAHTSSMEYQTERFFETIGMGQYDVFGISALYGRVLETFDTDRMAVGEQSGFGVRHLSQLISDNLIFEAPATLRGLHYTEQARRMRVFDPSQCRDATREEIEHAEWRIVHGKVCAPPPKDYARWDDFETSSTIGRPDLPDILVALNWRVKSNVKTAPGSVRWPYRWGVTNNSYVHTNPFDAGADIYEATQRTIERFDYSYPFTYFRRQRQDYNYTRVPFSTFSGYLERLRSYHWLIATDNARARAAGLRAFETDAQSDDELRPGLIAQSQIFGAIAKVIMMPQIGNYSTLVTPIDSTRAVLDADDGEGQSNPFPPGIGVDASTGRYLDPDFDSSPGGGGSWEYQNWILRAGFTLEKALAALSLTDVRPTLSTIRRQTYLDGRDEYVSFGTDMPQAVDRLIGGLLAGDWESVAPYVTTTGAAPEVQYLDLASLDTEPVRPSEARLIFPNVGYRQQLGTLIFAQIFSRIGTDLSLANKLRLWVEGLSDEITLPEAEQIRFHDPETGYTYIARRYGTESIDGKVVEKGIASRMLEHANALLAGSVASGSTRPGAYQVETDEDGVPLFDALGMPTLLLDESGLPIPRDEARRAELRRYIGLLDTSVEISQILGYGPFPGSFD